MLEHKRHILILVLIITGKIVFGQSGLCDPNVPYYYADLSGDPMGTYISPQDSRQGLCCTASNPDRCIEFEVLLHPASVGLAFDIFSGAEPPGALFYQINCGPPIPVGEPICLSGQGPHVITFCKPGANPNQYSITSIPGIITADSIEVRETCDYGLEIAGTVIENTITWNDITGGGIYNDSLSCTAGCFTTQLTAPINLPFIDIEVCGEPESDVCNGLLDVICDTIRVNINTNFTVVTNPSPPYLCHDDTEVTFAAVPSIQGVNYIFEWYQDSNALGSLLSMDSVLTVFNTGYYSVIVEDSILGFCTRDTLNVNINILEPPGIGDTMMIFDVCFGGSIQLNFTDTLFYTWQFSPDLSCLDCSDPVIDPIQDTMYFLSVLDAFGCTAEDSIRFNFIEAFLTYDSVQICAGEVYNFHGDILTQTGSYTDTIVTAANCDSIVFLELEVIPQPVGFDTFSICAGDTLFIDNTNFTQAGSFNYIKNNTIGCDSIKNLELFVIPLPTGTDTFEICNGDTIYINNQPVTTAGNYLNIISQPGFCDSIIDVRVEVLPWPIGQEVFEICPGDTIYINNLPVTTSGIYPDTLTIASSCDSIVQNIVQVLSLPTGIQPFSLCINDTIYINNQPITTAGTYLDTLSILNNCDSIVEYQIQIIPFSVGMDTAYICNNDTLFLGNQIITTPGLYMDTLTGFQCDSLVNYTVLPSANVVGSSSVFICEGDTLFINGQIITGAGSVTDTLQGLTCDSIHTYSVLVNSISTDTINLILCNGDSAFLEGSYQSAPGIYLDIYNNILGCDSLVYTALTFQEGQDLPGGNYAICAGDSIFLNIDSFEIVNWTPDNGLSCNDCPNPIVSPDYSTTYTITAPGCGDEILINEIYISVQQIPEIIFRENKPEIILGESIRLEAFTDGGEGGTFWMEGTDTLCTNCTWTTVSPAENTTYLFGAINSAGCSAVELIQVRVRNECDLATVEIPNVLSPNGDGNNDLFQIRYEGLKTVNLIRIFDRWGTMVYETNDLLQAWDGTYRGQALNSGVYVYYLEGVCLSNEIYIKKGNVTLLR